MNIIRKGVLERRLITRNLLGIPPAQWKMQKLRKGFEGVGRRGPFIPATGEGDPTNSTMYRFKMDLLMENMRLTIKGKRGVLKLRLAERRAMYAYCFSAIKRLAGAGHVVSPNTYRMPNNAGLVFNCTWDKTLRMNSHCFGFKCTRTLVS